MIKKRVVVWLFLFAWSAAAARGQEHRAEVIDGAPQIEGLTDKVASLFAAQGVRVLRGSNRTVCEIWPLKKWDVTEGFQATTEHLYPFQSGQLVAILRFKRRNKDFREQTIKSGWYTLRYGLQPTDGNHEGTSPTRDFLLMVPVAKETSGKPMELKQLLAASGEAAGASHPAMLCLQPAAKMAPKKPTMRHLKSKDWWVLQFAGNADKGGKLEPLGVELIVAGHADE